MPAVIPEQAIGLRVANYSASGVSELLAAKRQLCASRVKDRRQSGISPLGIAWNGCRFVAQAKVECQIGAEFPIVLKIYAEDCLSGFTGSGFSREIRGNLLRAG